VNTRSRTWVAATDATAHRQAARVALIDQGVDAGAADVSIRCSVIPCYQPGAEVTVTVGSTVRLPLVPDVLAGAVNAEIPVDATHASVIDRFRAL
jgi:hypothetical protein